MDRLNHRNAQPGEHVVVAGLLERVRPRPQRLGESHRLDDAVYQRLPVLHQISVDQGAYTHGVHRVVRIGHGEDPYRICAAVAESFQHAVHAPAVLGHPEPLVEDDADARAILPHGSDRLVYLQIALLQGVCALRRQQQRLRDLHVDSVACLESP